MNDITQRLADALRELLFAYRNADETGYVADTGFIDVDGLQERCEKLLDEYDAALDAPSQGEEQGWISVEERLPEDSEDRIVYGLLDAHGEEYRSQSAWWDGEEWKSSREDCYGNALRVLNVTHHRDFPPAPETQEDAR